MVVVYSSLEIILQQYNNFQYLDYIGFNDYTYGLGYSKVSNQVFASKPKENIIRVLANDGFFNRTLYVIGNAFNNNTVVSPPNASGLNYPYKIHQDCAGGFWVVDSRNCRVLHFGWSQTCGCSDWTTQLQHGLYFQRRHLYTV